MAKNIATKPYRNASGAWYTSALFWERQQVFGIERAVEPVFSLYMDKPGLINCQRTFVNLGDPTGYQWAMTYLGDWNHWLYLMERSAWFREAYAHWLAELTIKQKAEAIQRIREIAEDPENKQSLPAARYVAEQGWERTPGTRRGRPTKEEVAGELKQAAEARTDIDDDFDRIGLMVIEGGKP